MTRFRKIPVEIEAWPVRELVHAASRDWKLMPKPVADAYDEGVVLFPVDDDGHGYITIKTLEGTMEGKPDDWVIQGVQGELYPCKPDIFAATYEAES